MVKKKVAEKSKKVIVHERPRRVSDKKLQAMVYKSVQSVAQDTVIPALRGEFFEAIQLEMGRFSKVVKNEVEVFEVEVSKKLEAAMAVLRERIGVMKSEIPDFEKIRSDIKVAEGIMRDLQLVLPTMKGELETHLKSVYKGWAPTQLTGALRDVGFLKRIAAELRALQA